ncbi:unnamed protein product [Amoebophrya sp. A25]|nr:unnamed protein product [Amoebophrya sp. A25]|eukprot:GSA25T00024683001.1
MFLVLKAYCRSRAILNVGSYQRSRKEYQVEENENFYTSSQGFQKLRTRTRSTQNSVRQERRSNFDSGKRLQDVYGSFRSGCTRCRWGHLHVHLRKRKPRS